MLYSDHPIYQISTFFYYRKKGEGGGQKIIISENVYNYGRPPNKHMGCRSRTYMAGI